jgi:hypothetical protein
MMMLIIKITTVSGCGYKTACSSRPGNWKNVCDRLHAKQAPVPAGQNAGWPSHLVEVQRCVLSRTNTESVLVKQQ